MNKLSKQKRSDLLKLYFENACKLIAIQEMERIIHTDEEHELAY